MLHNKAELQKLPDHSFHKIASKKQPYICCLCGAIAATTGNDDDGDSKKTKNTTLKFILDTQLKKPKCADCNVAELKMSDKEIHDRCVVKDKDIAEKLDPLNANARMKMRSIIRRLFVQVGNDAELMELADHVEHALWCEANSVPEFEDPSTLKVRLDKASADMQRKIELIAEVHNKQNEVPMYLQWGLVILAVVVCIAAVLMKLNF